MILGYSKMPEELFALIRQRLLTYRQAIESLVTKGTENFLNVLCGKKKTPEIFRRLLCLS